MQTSISSEVIMQTMLKHTRYMMKTQLSTVYSRIVAWIISNLLTKILRFLGNLTYFKILIIIVG